MDDVLRFVRGAGFAAQFCEYAVLWHGICGDGWNGVGLVDKLVFYPVCGDGYGRTLLEYAYEVCRFLHEISEKETDILIVVDFIMQQLCSRPLGGAHLRLGLQAGRIGWCKSPARLQLTMLLVQWCSPQPQSQIRVMCRKIGTPISSPSSSC